jgi:putative sterol carrier protein
MATYPFLSDEWVNEARKIREKYVGSEPSMAHQVRMNLVVTEVPFADHPVDAHMDSSDGSIELGTGHLPEPDLTITVDYDTAKAILVDGNPQAGIQAFMTGRIRVEGDLAKLVALQGAPSEAAQEVARHLKEITQ